MKSAPKIITIDEVRIILGLPNHLIRAVVMDFAQKFATCFVSTIAGSRCTVLRFGSAVGIRWLMPNDYHYLSPARPGKVDTLDNVRAEYSDPQFNSFFKNRLAPTITI